MKKRVIIYLAIISFLFLMSVMVFYTWNKGFGGGQRPGKCLFTTNLGCRKAEKIEVRGELMLGIKSDRNEIIFSPIDGKCKKDTVFYESSEGKQYVYVSIEGDVDGKKVKVGFIAEDGLNCQSGDVKKGDVLGTINSKLMVDYQKNNLVISVVKLQERINDFDYYVTDDGFINKLLQK